ncbi:zinc metalloprotease HtpX [Aceticella autotrophica]|uniref:Protease HtpX homolog n=1 Tax=Aceticella autotrophica TaxID=2755338 RepID=A0A975AX43_9THEO|nr:zinc metalloprotease HtpX [Aceticella autotrophica]QSZ27996.1 zinc metalloprotease HtpX [Aceticella autotrophica]
MEKKTLYELQTENVRKTYLFLVLFSMILFAIGYFFVWYFNWGISGLILLAVFIIIYNWISYENSDKIALTSVRAVLADPNQYQVLNNVVEEVALAAGIPKPKVYIMNEPQPNAFATGKDPQHASVCVTTGLLQMMNREELQGVIAHEISHIRNRDILLMTVVAIVAGLIILLRDVMFRSMWFGLGGGGRKRAKNDNGAIVLVIVGLILSIVAPLIVMIIRSFISRQREYLADATGAYIVRDPYGLASALEKIGGYSKPMRTASNATAHMFISNPFGHVEKLFATHPPIQQRIERLKNLTM